MLARENEQQVRYHLRTTLVVEHDHAVRLEPRQCLLDHGHCALDDLLARGDNGACLLSLQHCLSYLGGVCEGRDAYLEHFKTRDRDARCDLFCELGRDEIGAASQRLLAGAGLVIGVRRGDVSKCGFRLGLDELNSL